MTSLAHRLVMRHPRVRALLTRLLVPDRETDITVANARLRINRRKELGYYRAHKAGLGNVVFRDEMASLLNLALILERGDTFVDVGANVGLYSALLGRLSRIWPENRWYAFEANADTMRRLHATLEGMPTRAFNLAVSNHSGELECTAGAVSGVFGATCSRSIYQYGPPIRVPCTTLDEVGIEGDRIVIKVDVEGHERQVLEGAEQLIGAHRVKAIYLDGFTDKRLPEWLAGRGFRIRDGRSLAAHLPAHSLLAVAI